MKRGILLPFLFGQRVQVTKDVHVTEYRINLHVKEGTCGLVIRTSPMSGKTWIQIPGTSRDIPISNLILLPINEDEIIETRFSNE